MLQQSAFTLVNKQNGNLAFKLFSFEDNSHFDIVNYHLEKSTHKLAFEKVGMTKVNWHPVQLSPELKKDDDKKFWRI